MEIEFLPKFIVNWGKNSVIIYILYVIAFIYCTH